VSPAPPSVALSAPAPAHADDSGRPGFFGSLASSLRSFMLRRSEEPVDAGQGQPVNARNAPSLERGIEPLPAQGHPVAGQDYPPARQQFEDAPASPAVAFHSPSVDERPDQAGQQAQIDEIRASLREFREAVRELTESRSRRRYF
jgi:hypothetical protein